MNNHFNNYIVEIVNTENQHFIIKVVAENQEMIANNGSPTDMMVEQMWWNTKIFGYNSKAVLAKSKVEKIIDLDSIETIQLK